MRKIWLCSTLIVAGCVGEVAGTGDSKDVAALTGDFVAIPRDFTATERSALKQQALSNSDGTFYIAIRRSELGKRYFLQDGTAK